MPDCPAGNREWRQTIPPSGAFSTIPETSVREISALLAKGAKRPLPPKQANVSSRYSLPSILWGSQ